ncbi:hypothetical protein GOBAR_AA17888 [Gossypium barbadense]|uniref:Uncharacterized protein n=1 Tax=Gossypium barbadense TaxID=3634 RepID=A0A2P5XHE8_GOSBA|nr:hypothetical protein GOBAR_AA17888 [Gossypium barbadense]
MVGDRRLDGRRCRRAKGRTAGAVVGGRRAGGRRGTEVFRDWDRRHSVCRDWIGAGTELFFLSLGPAEEPQDCASPIPVGKSSKGNPCESSSDKDVAGLRTPGEETLSSSTERNSSRYLDTSWKGRAFSSTVLKLARTLPVKVGTTRSSAVQLVLTQVLNVIPTCSSSTGSGVGTLWMCGRTECETGPAALSVTAAVLSTVDKGYLVTLARTEAGTNEVAGTVGVGGSESSQSQGCPVELVRFVLLLVLCCTVDGRSHDGAGQVALPLGSPVITTTGRCSTPGW